MLNREIKILKICIIWTLENRHHPVDTVHIYNELYSFIPKLGQNQNNSFELLVLAWPYFLGQIAGLQ